MGDARRSISIIVPAHNEARVIGRCHESMTTGAEPGELEILVVCNGCSDDTASVARRHGPYVQVLESEIASKNAALNLGNQVFGLGVSECDRPRQHRNRDQTEEPKGD